MHKSIPNQNNKFSFVFYHVQMNLQAFIHTHSDMELFYPGFYFYTVKKKLDIDEQNKKD